MKFKAFLIPLFLTVFVFRISAVNDTIILKSEIYSEKISADLDSLVNSWYVKTAMKEFPEDFKNDSIGVEFPDSVYIDRDSAR